MFGLRSKSADGFLGAAPAAPEPTPVAETFAQATARAAREHTAKQLQAAGENAALAVDVWASRLNESQRVTIRLAIAVEERDPDLSATLRALAAESIKTGLAPVAGWYRGLGLPGF